MQSSGMTTAALSLLCLLFLAIAVGGVWSQEECDDATMRRCRRNGLEGLEGRRNDDPCKNIRENFDCLLWQTSSCLDKEGQDENRESITKMWRYLQSFCESQGNWYTRPCYQKDEVRRCEALLPARGYSTDPSSCRSFSGFRDCVTSVVLSECSTADRSLLGTYMMEKGQQRAWNCPRSTRSPNTASLADFSSYSSCSEESRSSVQNCRNQFDHDQREARNRNDSDMKHHTMCCALVHYETCVKRAVQDYCGDRLGARDEARDLVSEMKERFPYYSCEDHTETECSTASLNSAALLLALLCVILSGMVTQRLKL